MAKTRNCSVCWQPVEIGKPHNCKPIKPEPPIEQPESDPIVPESEPVAEHRSECEDGQGSLYGDTKEKRNKRAREWRERNREKHREYMREYMRRKRKGV